MMGDFNNYYSGRGGAGVPSVQYGREVRLGGPQQAQPTLFNARAFKVYGAVLALLAAAAMALGVADVVLTKQAYCNPWTDASPFWCSTTKEPYIWTWVAPGIWASIPIFFAGIFAMCLSTNPGQWTRVFALLIFLSAIVFAPGMCVLSSIEVWRGAESTHNFYKLNNGLTAGDIQPSDNPYQAKFAIPLVIAILAAIMFFLTILVAMCLCCCMHSIGIYLPQEISMLQGGGGGGQIIQQGYPVPRPNYPPQREVYYPSRPQIRNYDMDPYYRSSGNPYAGFGGQSSNVPTRYNGGVSNFMYGNFASRGAGNGGGNFASDFFKPNPAYFWQ